MFFFCRKGFSSEAFILNFILFYQIAKNLPLKIFERSLPLDDHADLLIFLKFYFYIIIRIKVLISVFLVYFSFSFFTLVLMKFQFIGIPFSGFAELALPGLTQLSSIPVPLKYKRSTGVEKNSRVLEKNTKSTGSVGMGDF